MLHSTEGCTFAAAALAAAALVACGNGDGPAPGTGRASTPKAAFLTITNCLRTAGLQARGGPKRPRDPDAPAYEVVFGTGEFQGEGGFIALYDSEGEAQERLPAVEASADEFGGLVRSRGSTTVVWRQSTPSAEERDAVLECVR